MKNEEKYLKSRMGEKNPFRVPEGYFDSLTAQVMERLPEEAGGKVVVMRPTLVERLRPVFYVAACLLIAVLSFAVYFDQSEAVGDQPMVAEQSMTGEQYFDEVADYAMVDNYDIYACLTNE